MFLAVEPPRAILSDINGDLVEAWQQTAEQADKLLKRIRQIPVNAETYSKIRAQKPRTALSRAVRFIYLNRCCYGGLYRTNRAGQFNVPYGGGSRTPAPLWERAQLDNAQRMLRKCDVRLYQQDFENVVESARRGDVCFLDPTYAAITRGQFDRYDRHLFTWSDQLRLFGAVERAVSRGVIVVVSNVDCDEVRELYDGRLVISLERPKCIGNVAKNMRSKRELLIVFDDSGWRDVWIKSIGGQTVSRKKIKK